MPENHFTQLPPVNDQQLAALAGLIGLAGAVKNNDAEQVMLGLLLVSQITAETARALFDWLTPFIPEDLKEQA